MWRPVASRGPVRKSRTEPPPCPQPDRRAIQHHPQPPRSRREILPVSRPLRALPPPALREPIDEQRHAQPAIQMHHEVPPANLLPPPLVVNVPAVVDAGHLAPPAAPAHDPRRWPIRRLDSLDLERLG